MENKPTRKACQIGRPFFLFKKFQKCSIKNEKYLLNKISFNARGICDVAGRKRSGAEFSDGHFAYPELCDVAPPGRRPKERRAQRGLARARCAKSRRPER